MTMKDAVGRFVRDGDLVVMEGFTHLIPFAAGHEIIRQKSRDLTLARLTPDLIYDQLIAAGCVKKMIFSWAGNPGVGPLHAFRRAVEKGTPRPLEIEEYTHFGMVLRFMAGASNLPFLPTRNYPGTDLTSVNPLFRKVRSPYSDEELWCVPALHPDEADRQPVLLRQIDDQRQDRHRKIPVEVRDYGHLRQRQDGDDVVSDSVDR